MPAEYLKKASGWATLGAVPDPAAASQADIDAAIEGLVDTSPTTLDTLNELAAALADDPNFATTMTNALAVKLDSAGHAAIDHTGVPGVGGGGGVENLARSTTQAQVSGTNVETTLATLGLTHADNVQSGDLLTFLGAGHIANGTAGQVGVTFAFKLGGTTIFTRPGGNFSAGLTYQFMFRLNLWVASATVQRAMLEWMEPGGGSGTTLMSNQPWVGRNDLGVDLSTVKALTLSAANGTTSASFATRLNQYSIDRSPVAA